MHKLWVKSPFIRLTAPYFLFILIPVIILNVVIWQATRMTEENEVQRIQSQLAQGRDVIEARMNVIATITPMMQYDHGLLELDRIGNTTETRLQYHVYKAIQSMQRLNLALRDVTAILYYHENDVLLSPSFVTSSLQSRYGDMFRFGEYDYEEFLDRYLLEKNQPVFFPDSAYLWNGLDYSGILYGVRLSSLGNAYLYFLLERPSIEAAFAPLLGEGMTLLAYDAAGKLLYHAGQSLPEGEPHFSYEADAGLLDDSIFGKGRIAAYAWTNQGLHFLSVVERATAFQQTRSLRSLAVYLNIAAVMLTLLYAALLTLKNSRRLSGLLKALGQGSEFDVYQGGNVLDYLNNSMLQILSSYDRLREDADTRQSILQAAYLDKLVSGSFTDRTEASVLASNAGLNFSGQQFCVLALFLEHPSDSADDMRHLEAISEAKQTLLSHLLEQQEHCLVYSRNLNQIMIVMRLASSESDRYQQAAEALLAGCPAVPSIRLTCIGSGLYEDILATGSECGQCRDCYLRIPPVKEHAAILWADTIEPPAQNMFSYPPDLEKRILSQIQAGDAGGTLKSLQQALSGNLIGSNLDRQMQRVFLGQIQMTLLKSLQPVMIEVWRDRILAVDTEQPPGEFFFALCSLAEELCGSYAELLAREDAVKRQQMAAFLQENFQDPDISLRSAAEHFGLSEAYFSQLFKDTTGDNFSSFLEAVRLGHAQQLLADHTRKIDEIALACGYSSTNTFRRAYKRYYGVSPSTGRQAGTL